MSLLSPRIPLMSLCAAALVLGAGPAVEAAKSKAKAKSWPAASATLVNANGAVRGLSRAVQTKEGVKVTVWGEGLSPGEHGLHIHTTGTCTPPDFASAGAHWNPTMKQHGMNNPQGKHQGDLPNLTIGADGKGMVEFLVPDAKVKDAPDPLLDPDGAAIVVHAGPDDMVTDPSGNSGGRIACGTFAAE